MGYANTWLSASLSRSCLCAIGLCLTGVSNGATNIDICQEPITESHLAFSYFDSEETPFERDLGETNRENFRTDVQFKTSNNWLLGVGHRSTVLNVDRLEPQTNGYLHTFFFPIHKLSQSEDSRFRLSIAPALSGSSNVTKDPDEYTADALQMLMALVWGRQVSDRLGLRFGICADHRLGGYKVYPVISADWQPRSDWMIEIGFPTIQLSHQIRSDLSSSLRLAPDGNEWYVKNRSLDKRSQLVYETYMVEWTLDWRARQDVLLSASIGREFHSNYEMTLQDDSRVRLSNDSATRFGVAVAWYY